MKLRLHQAKGANLFATGIIFGVAARGWLVLDVRSSRVKWKVRARQAARPWELGIASLLRADGLTHKLDLDLDLTHVQGRAWAGMAGNARVRFPLLDVWQSARRSKDPEDQPAATLGRPLLACLPACL